MMMRNLLEKDFVNFYNKNPENPIAENSVNILYNSFNGNEFELIDANGGGVAKYLNPSNYCVLAIEFENFVRNLPPRVRNSINSDVCDYIVYSDNIQHFLLNELTNTEPEYVFPYENTKGQQEGKETKAVNQMLKTLNYLLAVVSIKQFIQKFSLKKCCFFNKQHYNPNQTNEEKLINAVPAFNRTPMNYGVHLIRPEIESLGFEFWSFSGNQTYLLEGKASKIENIADQLIKLLTKELKELTEELKEHI